MFRSALAILSTLSLAGCVVYGGGHPSGNGYDEAPYISYADASCYWDDGYGDFVWWFQADVEDPENNVVSVTTDVYDQYTGQWVDAFELYYDGGNTWFSAWQGYSTYLDCEYYQYSVDFVAEDASGNMDAVTIDLW